MPHCALYTESSTVSQSSDDSQDGITCAIGRYFSRKMLSISPVSTLQCVDRSLPSDGNDMLTSSSEPTLNTHNFNRYTITTTNNNHSVIHLLLQHEGSTVKKKQLKRLLRTKLRNKYRKIHSTCSNTQECNSTTMLAFGLLESALWNWYISHLVQTWARHNTFTAIYKCSFHVTNSHNH